MKQYFYLQLKRHWRIFPTILTGTLVALACIALILGGMWKADQHSADKQRFKIAITGDTTEEFVQMGLLALQTFDDTRFAMEVVELPQEEARQQLLQGKISAYVVLPEDFIQRALRGDVDTVTYVTHAGGENIVSMFKNEMTKVITDLVVYSQKGVYAVGQAAADHGLWEKEGPYMDALAMNYVELIFARAQICTIEELGISKGLDTLQYYISSLSVFLLLFIGVAFVAVGVRRDHSLSKLLSCKGFGPASQVLYEYSAHFILLLTMGCVLTGIVSVAGIYLKDTVQLPGFFSLLLRLIPIAAMAAALNGMLFEFTGNVVSAVLWHFFTCLGQCYIAGCFYPVYALPQTLQKIAGFLPAGVAREFLSGSFLQEGKWAYLAGILGYTALFWGATVVLRWSKLRTSRR